jgi:BirA family biotin operon repressor/biotin-[acetyl-CoA-carboxylase] ligase
MSVGWTFDEMASDISALTLASGLVIRRTLRDTAGVGIQLKWPNDLIWDDRKLGGILIELKAESHGSCFIVIGMGLNVSSFPADLDAESHWSNGAVDLVTATGGTLLSRNRLAASMIDALGGMLRSYCASGFSAYREEFDEADYLRGRHVSVLDSVDSIDGIASGIDADGALRLDMGDAVKRIIAGDVSVRTVA